MTRSNHGTSIAISLTLAFVLSSGTWAADTSTTPKVMAPEKVTEKTNMAKPVIAIKTTMGTIKAELWPDKAPATVENFLKYAKDKYYDGTVFHRIIANFMIQGGGFTSDLKKKSTLPPVKNEARKDVPNLKGTLAMARTSAVHSGTSQFFINLKDNGFLNHRDKTPRGYGYCVFGKVIAGLDVVEKIAAVKTGAKGRFRSDVPVETVIIESIRLVNTSAEKK